MYCWTFSLWNKKKPVVKPFNYLSQTLQKTEQALCSRPSFGVLCDITKGWTHSAFLTSISCCTSDLVHKRAWCLFPALCCLDGCQEHTKLLLNSVCHISGGGGKTCSPVQGHGERIWIKIRQQPVARDQIPPTRCTDVTRRCCTKRQAHKQHQTLYNRECCQGTVVILFVQLVQNRALTQRVVWE